LAVVEALLDMGERQEDMLYVGAPNSVEEKLADRHGLAFASAASGQLRGKAPWTVARSLARLAQGVTQARQVIADFGAKVVLSTGGYAGAPALIAARKAGVPALIYLPDIEPGMTIKLLSRLAQSVAVSFEDVRRFFPPAKVIVTGYPVRKALWRGDRVEARRRLGLPEDGFVLLAFGGSQGARSINMALAGAAERLAGMAHVIHMTGSLDFETVSERVRSDVPEALQSRYRVREYLYEEMTDALLAADLVTARAGASVLGEFPAAGVPAILAPYPYSGQHQYANARFMERHGAAIIIEDALLGSQLADTIERVLRDEGERHRMAEAMRGLARPAAARDVALGLRYLAAAAGRKR
jgi:UDP-N-acetylglucosamine--N-acetylmuramyl-(pentapeptide) pyrophosphoryl-undecaprenol N-acetylglucosamine transferase